MTLKEACKSALTILKQVMEEKLNATNVEVRVLFVYVYMSKGVTAYLSSLCEKKKGKKKYVGSWHKVSAINHNQRLLQANS